MRKKKDNNLVLMTVGDRKRYFTSMNRAAFAAGIVPASVKWAILNGNVLITDNDEKMTFEIVDGSNIQYKFINN